MFVKNLGPISPTSDTAWLWTGCRDLSFIFVTKDMKSANSVIGIPAWPVHACAKYRERARHFVIRFSQEEAN